MSRETRYKPSEFVQLINRSVGTLRIWDKKGKLTAKRRNHSRGVEEKDAQSVKPKSENPK